MSGEQAASHRAEGGCTCGQVRYRICGSPLFVHCCHCTKCQTESGSAFALNALIEADRVQTISGAAEPIMTPTESGRPQQVWRCPSCKVALWSKYAGAGDLVSFVRVGTLDNRGAIEPDLHIYTRSKLPWVCLPEKCLAVEAYYDRKAYWPEASLRRLEALFSRGAGKL